jgi:hypothetical protein
MPGRGGYGIGHQARDGFTHDSNGTQLKDWIGNDSRLYQRFAALPSTGD